MQGDYTMEFTTKLSDTMNYLNKKLDVDGNFDLVYRTFYVAGREACIYYIEGFTKGEVWQKLMEDFASLTPDVMPPDAHEFSKKYLPYSQVGLVKDEEAMIKQLLAGISCLFIDGYD